MDEDERKMRILFDRHAAKFEALSDEDLLEEWAEAGRLLHDESPEEFRLRYLQGLGSFADKPSLEPTLANWIRLGARLAQDPTLRKVLAKLTVLTYLKADIYREERKLS